MGIVTELVSTVMNDLRAVDHNVAAVLVDDAVFELLQQEAWQEAEGELQETEAGWIFCDVPIYASPRVPGGEVIVFPRAEIARNVLAAIGVNIAGSPLDPMFAEDL